jgi:hypothetical protein
MQDALQMLIKGMPWSFWDLVACYPHGAMRLSLFAYTHTVPPLNHGRLCWQILNFLFKRIQHFSKIVNIFQHVNMIFVGSEVVNQTIKHGYGCEQKSF